MANDEISRGLLILETQIDDRSLARAVDASTSRIAGLFGRLGQTIQNTMDRAFGSVSQSATRTLDRGVGNALKTLEENAAAAGSGAREVLESRFGDIVGDADQAAGDIGGSFEGSADRIGSSFGRLGGIASSVLGTLTSAVKFAGLSIAGLAGTAIATGISFNQMSQGVNAALSAVLGSKEAASQLIDEVIELNRRIPFSRQSFLDLTKTLVGFGVSAEAVPGVLEGLSAAVASVGGGETDLLQLGQALARVAAQGRLTRQDLESFSTRGINVVELLAEAFDKSTDQINEDLSNGQVSAEEFIQVVGEVLPAKLGDALENVQKNLDGALSRFKGRLRDIGSVITAPFIDPVTGGAAVDVLNNISIALTKVRDVVAPLLVPAMERLGEILTGISEKFANFVSALDPSKIGAFTTQFSGLLPVLAGVVGLLPQLLSDLPVIGGLFNSLGGSVLPFAFALAAIPEGREAFAQFAQAIAPLAQELLPKFAELLTAITPILVDLAGGALTALAGVLKLVAEVLNVIIPFLTHLAEILQPFSPLIGGIVAGFVAYNLVLKIQIALQERTAIVTALLAVKTVILTGVQIAAALATEGLSGAMIILNAAIAANPIGAIVAIIVGLAAVVVIAYNKFKPFRDIVDAVGRFLGGGFKLILQVVIHLFKDFGTAIGGVIRLAVRLLNILQPFKEFKFGGDEAAKSIKGVTDAGIKVKTNITDPVEKASVGLKGMKDAADAAKTSLTQTLDQTIAPINAVLAAGRAEIQARAAVDSARQKSADIATKLAELETKRAALINDTTADIRELAKAETELVRIGFRLRDLDQEEADLQQRLLELRGEDTADKRAAADRAIERAKISLNNARRAELELTKEQQVEDVKGIDLAGLTVGQIKTKLAAVREALAAQKAVTSETKQTGKSAQEIEDERLGKKLDVVDAEQALKNATQARQELEIATTKEIRESEEKLLELGLNRQDQLDAQSASLTALNLLRSGETTRAKEIKVIDDSITAAKREQTDAQAAVTAAINASKQAEAELALASAQLREDVKGQAEAQITLLNLKREGLVFDTLTNDKLNEQLTTIRAQATAVGTTTQALLTQQNAIQNAAIAKAITLDTGNIAASSEGKLVQALRDVVFSDPRFKQLLGPGNTGLFPHLAEGGYVGGAPGPHGRIHVAEYGRPEAILPITSQFHMERHLRDPRILNPILNALPRISLPQVQGRLNAAAASASPLRAASVNFARSGNAVTKRSDGPMTFGQAEDIKSLLKENGKAEVRVEAPIHVHSQIDEDMLTKKIMGKLERKIYDVLGRR